MGAEVHCHGYILRGVGFQVVDRSYGDAVAIALMKPSQCTQFRLWVYIAILLCLGYSRAISWDLSYSS